MHAGRQESMQTMKKKMHLGNWIMRGATVANFNPLWFGEIIYSWSIWLQFSGESCSVRQIAASLEPTVLIKPGLSEAEWSHGPTILFHHHSTVELILFAFIKTYIPSQSGCLTYTGFELYSFTYSVSKDQTLYSPCLIDIPHPLNLPLNRWIRVRVT